jgi:hypothetical protein
MMAYSDNRTTRGILEKFGKPAMLNLASSIGMTKTTINHNIGCPTSTPTAATRNTTSLTDLDKIYNGFATGAQVTNATWRKQFVFRMVNDDWYTPWRANVMCPLAQQEAPKVGKSSATATAFCNAMEWYAKGGSYQYGGSIPANVSYSGMDVTRLPVKSTPGGAITGYRDYIYGSYQDGTNVSGQAEIDKISAANIKAEQEALRAYVNSALATW